LIDALVAAGVQHIEAVSFVSPKAVPAMADAGEVMAQVRRPPGVRWVALVPNVRGAELALASGVDEITVTISASPAYNEKNVRMSIDESLEAIAGICALAGNVPVDGVVSCAFGSPYEGDLSVADVIELGDRVVEAGAASLTYADTTGMGTPRRVAELVSAAGVDIGFHFHDTVTRRPRRAAQPPGRLRCRGATTASGSGPRPLSLTAAPARRAGACWRRQHPRRGTSSSCSSPLSSTSASAPGRASNGWSTTFSCVADSSLSVSRR
jgi:hypothetical protein